MSIDMVWVWLAVITSTFIFQNHFTEKKTTWDVSYTYTTEAMNYIAYGQVSLTSAGESLPWRAAKTWVEKNVMKDDSDDKSVTAVILAVHKDTCKRFFVPFWKHMDWYR